MQFLVKMKINAFLLFAIPAAVAPAFGQYSGYRYQRPVEGIEEGWGKIELPDEVFGKIRPDLSDIRIIGITAEEDTIEAPYLLKVRAERISSEGAPLRILNRSGRNGKFYYTLEAPSNEALNRLHLDFAARNFDLRVTLEGSHDQRQWFTLVEEYRVLSIRNGLADYQFATLIFPEAGYHYLRLSIPGPEDPVLSSAQYRREVVEPGEFRAYTPHSVDIASDRKLKHTAIHIDLPLPVPVSRIRIGVRDSFDYYRPVEIQTVVDSSDTPQGRRYSYRTLASGTLSSLEPGVFTFPSVVAQKLRIIIRNYDNEPLRTGDIEVEGNPHELRARFTRAASYYLLYGDPQAPAPNYDINIFGDKVPGELLLLSLGPETASPTLPPREPLFKNKVWLWAVMGIVILALGWFTVRMMRGREGGV
jgi:hypothetical protein